MWPLWKDATGSKEGLAKRLCVRTRAARAGSIERTRGVNSLFILLAQADIGAKETRRTKTNLCMAL